MHNNIFGKESCCHVETKYAIISYKQKRTGDIRENTKFHQEVHSLIKWRSQDKLFIVPKKFNKNVCFPYRRGAEAAVQSCSGDSERFSSIQSE